jgi:hypothetical protein
VPSKNSTSRGMYTVERERTYDGEGELIDAGGYACIVYQ